MVIFAYFCHAITGINPRASPGPYIRRRAAGYWKLRFWRDYSASPHEIALLSCSTNKFLFTSFLKFESHE
jgi:hypothetical protein